MIDALVFLLPPPILIVLSSLAQIPPSYFSKKGNIFNLFFVKILWVWVTAAFILLRPNLRSAQRYLGLTAAWVFVTQWCFGPPMIDRSFTLSGGSCSGLDVYSQMECRQAGGSWEGGHDISGHVFLLTLASVSLWFEISKTRSTERTSSWLSSFSVGAKFALGVSLASMWMLMMTAAYFHTWFEKLTGLIAAYTSLFLVYWLPDLVA